MQVSAEVRWFWASPYLKPLRKWFLEPKQHSGILSGGGVKERTDRYFPLGQDKIGLKVRGISPGDKKFEVKGLIATSAVEEPALAALEVQIWCKWPLTELKVSSALVSVDVKKLRWVRKFNTVSSVPVEVPTGPDENPLDGPKLLSSGCTVEYTEIEAAGRTFTTFGLEAFGDLKSVEESLRMTLAAIRARRFDLPAHSVSLSYPAWLFHLQSSETVL